jgi:hypothetical protein
MKKVKRYYVMHGINISGQFDELDDAIECARDFVKKYGKNHSWIKIGDRRVEDENNVLMMVYRNKWYLMEDNNI